MRINVYVFQPLFGKKGFYIIANPVQIRNVNKGRFRDFFPTLSLRLMSYGPQMYDFCMCTLAYYIETGLNGPAQFERYVLVQTIYDGLIIAIAYPMSCRK